MRKRVLCLLFVLIIGLFVFACSKGDASGDSNKSVSLKKAAVLVPGSVDLSRPIGVKQLTDAFFAWKGKRITITGYCNFFFDEGEIGKSVKIVANPGDKDKLITCAMRTNYSGRFAKTVPVVIEGTIKRKSYWGIELIDCKLVSKGKKPATVKAAVNAASGSVFEAGDFARAYSGWLGKEVSVIGYYWGTTTSTTKYGKTIRVDLQDPKHTSIKVGCEMKEKHERITKRAGTIIRGRVSGQVFGGVRMTNCVFVNR